MPVEDRMESALWTLNRRGCFAQRREDPYELGALRVIEREVVENLRQTYRAPSRAVTHCAG